MYRLGVVGSEEHTSELQSLAYLVCRLLLEKKKHTDVPRELDEDRRLVVCVREALATLLEGHPHDVLRFDLDSFHLAALRDVSVLAIFTQPITSGRRDAEDLRSRPIVRDRFLLDRVDVARDHPAVHVEPQLAIVNASNPAQPNLALADLAVPRARGAHDPVRPLDGLPELGDFAHRLARRLADVKDFRLRNHRCQYTARLGLKHFASGLPNPGRTEGFRAIDPSASARILQRGPGRAEKELAAPW